MKKRTSHQLGVLALITASAFSGINNPVIRSALKVMPVYLFGFLRVTIALCIIGPLALYLRRKRTTKQKQISRKDMATIIVGSLMLFCGANLLFYLGVHRSTSINASIIALLGPILIFIISVEFLKEKFNKKVFAGIGLSFVGASLVVLGPLIGQATSTSTSTLIGNVLLIISVIIDVTAVLILRRALARVHALDVLAIGLLASSIVYFVLALPYMEQIQLLSNGAVLKAVLFGSIVVGCFGYGLTYFGLSRTKGSDISITSYVNPVVGMTTAVVFFNERFTPSLMIGGAVVFIGLYLVEARNLASATHHSGHH